MRFENEQARERPPTNQTITSRVKGRHTRGPVMIFGKFKAAQAGCVCVGVLENAQRLAETLDWLDVGSRLNASSRYRYTTQYNRHSASGTSRVPGDDLRG